MTKHTPGPWGYDEIDRVVVKESVKDIAYMDSTASEADARLIAAAPCMLAALQACDETMEYMSEYDIPITLPGQVKAAIAKATGEE